MTKPLICAAPIRAITLVFGILAFLFAACSNADDSWQRISSQGLIRIGLDPSYPPFEATDGIHIYGIDVDLSEALASKLDLEAEFVHFGYDGLYDALLSNQVDVLISALIEIPERTKDFSYSHGYYNSGQLLILPGYSPIEDHNDLNAQIIAVELGAEGHLEALEWQRQNPNLTILPFNSTDEALNSLIEGRSDSVVADSIGTRLFIKDHTFPVDVLTVTNEPFVMVVRSGNEILLEKLNEALSTLKSTGQLDTIIDGWLNQ